MGKEIEKKFLVKSSVYKTLAEGVYYHQGYIPTQNKKTVRIRVAGEQGYITLKTKTTGITRLEYEYEVPVADAREMIMTLCEMPTIEKHRYKIPAGNGLIWEVDEFMGANEGLTIAEIELPTEETPFEKPDWIGDEVTADHRYYNSALCKHPYCEWKD